MHGSGILRLLNRGDGRGRRRHVAGVLVKGARRTGLGEPGNRTLQLRIKGHLQVCRGVRSDVDLSVLKIKAPGRKEKALAPCYLLFPEVEGVGARQQEDLRARAVRMGESECG